MPTARTLLLAAVLAASLPACATTGAAGSGGCSGSPACALGGGGGLGEAVLVTTLVLGGLAGVIGVAVALL